LCLETLERVFEKTFFNKKFSLMLSNILATFFYCNNKKQQKKQMRKNWGLLLLVVATKFFYRFFYHHVGAHLKNFWRARAATHQKNYSKDASRVSHENAIF